MSDEDRAENPILAKIMILLLTYLDLLIMKNEQHHEILHTRKYQL